MCKVSCSSVGGSAGSNIALTETNATDVFTAADTKLNVYDVPMADRVAVIGAHTLGVLRRMKALRETQNGDTVLANGVVGPLLGWTLVHNNNLPYTAVLGLATNPTDGDTITIAGVTYTFKATLGTDPGAIHIASTVDLTRANLAEAINDPYTAIRCVDWLGAALARMAKRRSRTYTFRLHQGTPRNSNKVPRKCESS
mgnify:CR=1 FL=1